MSSGERKRKRGQGRSNCAFDFYTVFTCIVPIMSTFFFVGFKKRQQKRERNLCACSQHDSIVCSFFFVCFVCVGCLLSRACQKRSLFFTEESSMLLVVNKQ